jgi:hypothetical protein
MQAVERAEPGKQDPAAAAGGLGDHFPGETCRAEQAELSRAGVMASRSKQSPDVFQPA